jgi:phosphate:Na+ symporter
VNTLTLFTILGGIALLLYGLQLLKDGLGGIAGIRLRSILGSVTQNRFIGLLTGALVAAVLQSGSAATVMLVGFTSAGFLTLSQSIAVILGADIGSTLTVQLIAFGILDLALAIVAVGFIIWFTSRNRRMKSLGLSILGFGFIFLALKVLIEGLAPFRSSEIVQQILLGVGGAPLLGILIATLLSALFHSSAATIGITLAFAAQDLMPLSSAIPIILGANIGSSATALLASIGTTAEARRVALAHGLFKILGVALFFPFLDHFETLVAATASAPMRQIANAHTFFNLGIALLFLPFTAFLAKLVTHLIPDRPELEEPGQPKYLDPRVLDTPALALGQATREALRVSDIVRDMYRDTIHVFMEDAIELAEDIQRRDDWVDRLDREIKLYITKLSAANLTEDQSQREISLLALTGDLETIGDIIDKNLMELAKKKSYKGLRFSDRGQNEIIELHEQVGRNFENVISAFAGQDAELARQVINEKATISQKERELRAAHIERLHEGLPESIETSAIHLDVLTNLVRINHHVISIAYPIAESKSM